MHAVHKEEVDSGASLLRAGQQAAKFKQVALQATQAAQGVTSTEAGFAKAHGITLPCAASPQPSGGNGAAEAPDAGEHLDLGSLALQPVVARQALQQENVRFSDCKPPDATVASP